MGGILLLISGLIRICGVSHGQLQGQRRVL